MIEMGSGHNSPAFVPVVLKKTMTENVSIPTYATLEATAAPVTPHRGTITAAEAHSNANPMHEQAALVRTRPVPMK